MKKDSTVSNGAVSPAHVSDGYAACAQMSEKVSNGNYVSYKAKNADCEDRQRPTREGPSSPVSTSSVSPSSHHQRWSADFSKSGTSPVIIVRKKKKEPQPPQRGVSLLTPQTASDRSFKRYSCPPVASFSSPSRSSSLSSSSSTSSTSSCSSPPPMQTSVITGRDPLGWKLRPKSSPTSPRARTNRLSLQIALPVVFPDLKSSPGPISTSDNTFNQDPSPKTRPKPSRRHSDSSAFLGSLASPLPTVTLEELCAVNLRQVTRSDGSEDVFSEVNGERAEVTAQRRKNRPPPVPEKTSTARAIAKLIAHSPQRFTPVTAKSTGDDTRVRKPQH